ncbi:MAG: iron-sulfur cluster insertion protein ErpA [Pseudomonadales bacterium]
MMAEIQDRATVNVQLTQESAEKVRQFMVDENLTPENSALRVSVLPGGCSGFQYGLDVEEELRDDDFVVESQGIKLYVDPFSAQYLDGIQIGYQSSFQGSGFTFSNPNASGGCGCGTSFAV